jgi:eukaryotic-like serine/threonine-protein kinase
MPEDSKSGPSSVSAAEFLAALERAGVLPEAKWREVQDRFVPTSALDDPLALAKTLVDQGTLTEFQARRLLRGKGGLTFGRYALVDHVGQGARGRVFKARHTLMDRVVALKVVLPDKELNTAAVDRFFREMKIVALLDHPNVVRAIDADIHAGHPYIVMEYLEGDDLGHLFVRRGPMPPELVIDYMAQAARGLAHAHEKGVIHRDIKPTNLFVVNTGIVKVLDLGCGELVGGAGQPGNVFDTDEGIVVGTTDFMSPEQVKDEAIDARTDLFSLGCTMYRLLSGEYAFPGTTREDRLAKRIRKRHVPITQVRPDLSEELVAIVDRLLAIQREDRFSSATLAAEALESLIPPTGRSEREKGAKPRKKPDSREAVPLPAEPEAPLDWSVIESALRPSRPAARKSSSLVETTAPKAPSSKGLFTHRKVLEEEGAESGREMHKSYRNELIQMNRAMTELRSTATKDEAQAEGPTWLERIGEKLGDALAEPSAAQILIVILAVLLALALALAYAVE